MRGVDDNGCGGWWLKVEGCVHSLISSGLAIFIASSVKVAGVVEKSGRVVELGCRSLTLMC